MPARADREKSSRNATEQRCNSALSTNLLMKPQHHLQRGLFIAFEGVDGSGKSTQASRCVARLQQRGFEVVAVREPGGTTASQAIRTLVLDPKQRIDPVAELLLYMAARSQLVTEVIAPALADGKIVVADRFGWSTVAYQGFGRGLDLSTIETLMGIACGPVWPHLTLVLDVPPEIRKSRLEQQGRDLDRLEREGEGFFKRVREGFLALAAEAGKSTAVLDGCLSPDILTESLIAVVEPYLTPELFRHTNSLVG